MTAFDVRNGLGLRTGSFDDYDALDAIKVDAIKMFGDEDRVRHLDKDAFDRSLKEGGLSIVTTAEGTPCGFTMVYEKMGDLYLRNIYVLRAYNRLGIGTNLLKSVIERAKKLKCRAVTLTTSGSAPWNAPFYVRHGFNILTERIPSYLEQALDKEREHFDVKRFPSVLSNPYRLPRVAMEKVCHHEADAGAELPR